MGADPMSQKGLTRRCAGRQFRRATVPSGSFSLDATRSPAHDRAFHVVENIALLQVLGSQPALFWAPLAGLVFSLKWILAFIVVAYVLVGGFRSLRRL
jgi:hypothetical protein